MTYWLSEPVESYLHEPLPGGKSILDLTPDYLIVGSGYGAAMAALAILEAHQGDEQPPLVAVLERGDEYVPGDFPKSIDDMPAYINYLGEMEVGGRAQNIRNASALWELRQGQGISVISGSGLGGTSLVNANVAARASDEVLAAWPAPEGEESSYWQQRLEEVYEKIELLLGVQEFPAARDFDKYQALDRTARQLGKSVAPARLSLLDDGEPTPYAADHGECNHCGNCVIGCHSGAKQSLNLNAWALAKQMGAVILTGATVHSVRAADENERIRNWGYRWYVNGVLTRDGEREFSLKAKTVILAAGTLGSTEILARSQRQQEAPLALSALLGQRFTGNGDMIFSSLGQRRVVNAMAEVPDVSADKARGPGPTILGKSEVNLADHSTQAPDYRITLEEGAVPFPLVQLWQEMAAAQDLLQSFTRSGSSAWHSEHGERDRLAVSGELARHGQVFLAMGMDGAYGELAFGDGDYLQPRWPKPEDAPGCHDYYRRLDTFFASREAACLDGGRYHPGMAWKPIPSGFSGAMEGVDDVGNHLLTVHPLGGCVMGPDAQAGVVNYAGCVYQGGNTDAGPTATHDGLYVLDGAILPGPVGTNPFMTIAALSYVLARALCRGDENRNGPFPPLSDQDLRTPPPGCERPVPTPEDQHVAAVFSERLCYTFPRDEASAPSVAGDGDPQHEFGDEKYLRWPWSTLKGPSKQDLNNLLRAGAEDPIHPDARTLVLDIEFYLQGARTLDQWLENPAMPLKAKATLQQDLYGSVLTVPDTHLSPICELTGSVVLGAELPVGRWGRLKNLCSVLWRFARYRWPDLVDRVAPAARLAMANPEEAPPPRRSSKSPIKTARTFFRIALHHARFRTMDYVFESREPTPPLPRDGDEIAVSPLAITGRKTIAYGGGPNNLWASLFTLPTQLRNGNDKKKEKTVVWEMDAVRLGNERAPLQVNNSLDFATMLSRVGGASFYLLRVLFQTHFWSFGAPAYRRFGSLQQMEEEVTPAESGESDGMDPSRLAPPPDKMTYVVVPETGTVSQPETRTAILETHVPDKGSELEGWCRLLRYRPVGVENPRPLLLVHGLAHSSRVFWTHTIDTNFVQYFLGRGYDVWIVDHRTSANLVAEVDPAHRWDDIALEDIPWAVDHIYENVNAGNTGLPRKVHVFAHCIGAGAVAIAALAGKLSVAGQDSKLASLVPHAVTPWLYASITNRARENAWALFKDLDLFEQVEPYPHRKTPFRETVFDRLASSAQDEEEKKQWKFWSRLRDPRGLDFAKSIYSRYTMFWGRQWWKANINDRTRQEFAGMVGATPAAVLQQVYFSITRGLLSNHDGENEYVVADKIEQHWTFPTLFFHGNRNTVFDIESSRSSAHMLTRHRMCSKGARSTSRRYVQPVATLTPRDYLENNVWIDVVNDYGHMDVIFGDKACEEIFPRFDTFFRAADDIAEGRATSLADSYPAELQRYQREVDQPAGPVTGDAHAQSFFHRYLAPRSHVGPVRKPVAGPVISRPSMVNGELRLKLWCEAQDFTSMPAVDLVCATRKASADQADVDPGCTILPMQHLQHDKVPADCETLEDEFWLYDLAVGVEDVAGLEFWMRYEGDGPDDIDGLSQGHCPPQSGIKVEWQQLDWYRRLLAKAADGEARPGASWLLGSCLYPGTLFDSQQAAAIFNSMWRHVRGSNLKEPGMKGVDHVLFVGDQIYADATANMFDPRAYYEKFRARYRRFMGSDAAARLLANVPCYFAIDDHEINDNWCGKDSENFTREDLAAARQLAWLYQMHGKAWDHGNVELYYSFESAGLPFFVFDTRSERKPKDRKHYSALVSVEQMAAFDEWLVSEAVQNAPAIFIASGSPFGPLTKAHAKQSRLVENDDNLLGYPGFLEAVLSRLQQVGDKAICWMSGNPHLSYSADVTLSCHGKQVKLYHIVSSGLYAPIKAINRCKGDLVLDEPVAIQGTSNFGVVEVTAKQKLISDHHQHFVRVDLEQQVDSTLIRVSAYDSRGGLVVGSHREKPFEDYPCTGYLIGSRASGARAGSSARRI